MKEVLKLALEALEGVLDNSPKVLDASITGGLYEVIQCRDAITAIKEALAQPEQEPAIGDIRALKHRIHALEGEVIGYKQIVADQDALLLRNAERIVDLQTHIENFDGEDR